MSTEHLLSHKKLLCVVVQVCLHVCMHMCVWLPHLHCGLYEFPLCSVDTRSLADNLSVICQTAESDPEIERERRNTVEEERRAEDGRRLI